MEPLKEGETICSECNGTGENKPGKRLGITIACRKCCGHGKLDWVEMIVGKGSWRVRPGVYISEIDLSAQVPSFEQSIKEIRESIIKSFKIPESLLKDKE